MAQRVRRGSRLFVLATAACSLLVALPALITSGLVSAAALPPPGTMRPPAALAITLAAIALLLHALPRSAPARTWRAEVALGLLVALIGLGGIAEALLGGDLHVGGRRWDHWPYGGADGGVTAYGAAGLAFLGAALAAARLRRMHLVVFSFAAAVALLGTLSLAAHAWGAPGLLPDRWAGALQVRTAAVFVLLGLGLVVAVTRAHAGRTYRMLLDRTERKLVLSLIGAVLAIIAVGAMAHEPNDGEARAAMMAATLVSWLIASALLASAFMVIRREMAARADAERQLRRSSSAAQSANRFLHSVVQNIPHMIFIKDARELRFVLLNRAGEKIFGAAEAQVLGKGDPDFFPPNQARFFMGRDREVLARGELLDIPEEEIQSPTLGPRILHTRKIPLRDERGSATHLLGISEDVTTAREQERQIRALNQELAARASEVEELNQAKSEFLATMSHEIRTPMHGMLGMLELLSLTPVNEQQRKMLAVVRESGEALLRIVNDILDFSKIEAEKLELREEVVSVAALLREIRNIHAPVASSKAVEVRATIDPALSPASWVDAVRLRQVLNNFASNAVKFTRAGEVEIRADVIAQGAEAQEVRFTVRDTGAGMSAEEQERLFNPFVQVGDARGGTSGGTGLGLVIARRLVELMGGTIRLQSAPGKGTGVSFSLELRAATPELLPKDMAQQTADLRASVAGVRNAPEARQAAAEGTLVLVVDDHPVNRMLVRDQLEILGYACDCAQDGDEALQKWRLGRYGLVLTDCQMPRMDGYELARRIRAQEAEEARPRTPVVACTAAAGELQQALAAGMDDCLVKPVQLAAMREKLQQWLPLPSGLQHASTQPPVIDTDLIASNWGSDPATIASIGQAFAASLKDDTRALREAAALGDFDAVGELAHRTLGASRMVGAQALAQICERLQMAGRDGDLAGVATAVSALETECVRVQREFG